MKLLSAAVLLLALTGGVSAQQADPFPRASHVVVPQRRSFTLRASFQPIRIENVRAHVKILEQTATTTLDITVRNPAARQAEAVLLLPVPDGAAIHSFLFAGSAAEPTATLLRKDEARRIYDSIVSKSRDPALLEFAGYGLVRSSVFPVPPNGGTQRVRLTYHHLLHANGARIDYVLPRSEALDVKVPWEVKVDIKAKTPIATVYSPSHALKVDQRVPRQVTVSLKKEAALEPGSFRLSYLRQENGVTASLFAYPDPKIGGGYFLLLAGLPKHQAVNAHRMKREVTIVIDRSGSMAGPKLEQVRAAALQVIEGLQDGEAFNLIDYGNSVAQFAPRPVVKGADTLAKARAYLASLRPRGGTNIHDALVEALRQKPLGKMLSIVLFLTDGLPTIGQTAEVAIRDAVSKGNPHERRVFTFGVGHDVNAPLLDRIAETTRAKPTYVLPEENVAQKVAEVFQRLYGPVLSDAKLQTLDDKGAVVTDRVREPIPAALPDLFEGDQLVLLGQYRGQAPLRFRLGGRYFGKSRAFEFRFDLASATTRNAFVPRLWASRRIAFLVDQIRQAGGATGAQPAVVGQSVLDDPRYKELVDEILRLSMEFGVLSEYTAFLAREGTDLANWNQMNMDCSFQIDAQAVKQRWGVDAIKASKNFEQRKKQVRENYRNAFLDEKLRRVEIASVQQVCDLSLFRRGGQWIDGRVVAAKNGLKPDRTISSHSAEYRKLLDQLVKEGRQAVLSFKGKILLRLNGETVLVTNDW